jgi:3-hydroxyacyl-[acyl-carrier-protein] dehydratase
VFDRARFRKPVIPGDQMIIQVDKQRNHGKVWKFVCKVTVEQVLAAEARITAMIMDKK